MFIASLKSRRSIIRNSLSVINCRNLSMEKIICSSPSSFDSKLKECESLATSSSRDLYVLFTGAKVDSTGRSWCPDCVAADPVISKVLASIPQGCVLLECPVVREEYRSPSFPYRTSKNINLKCVPTLIKWVSGKAAFRLDDSQSQVESLVRELIES